MPSLLPNGQPAIHGPPSTSPRDGPLLPTPSSNPASSSASSSMSRQRSSSSASNASSSSSSSKGHGFGFAFLRERRQSAANGGGIDGTPKSASGSRPMSEYGSSSTDRDASNRADQRMRQRGGNGGRRPALSMTRETEQENAAAFDRQQASSSKRMSRVQPTSLETFKAQQSMKQQRSFHTSSQSAASSSSHRSQRPPMSPTPSFASSSKTSRSTGEPDRTSSITYPPRTDHYRPQSSTPRSNSNRQSLPANGRDRTVGSTSISGSPYTVYQPHVAVGQKQPMQRHPVPKSPLSPTFAASSFPPSSASRSSSSNTSSPTPAMLKDRRSGMSLASSFATGYSSAGSPSTSPKDSSYPGSISSVHDLEQNRRPSWVSIRLPSLSAASNASFSRSSQGTITGFSTGSSDNAPSFVMSSGGGERDGKGRYDLSDYEDEEMGGNLLGAPLPSPNPPDSFPPTSSSADFDRSPTSHSSFLLPSRPPPPRPLSPSTSDPNSTQSFTSSPLEAFPTFTVPIIPARHPLRPRTTLEDLSQASSQSSSQQSGSTLSRPQSVASQVSRPDSMSGDGSRHEAGPNSVYLDDEEIDDAVEGDLARYRRRESTRDTSGDVEKRTTRMSVNSRASSTRSGVSGVMMAKRREARITSTYFTDEEGEEDVDFAAFRAQFDSPSTPLSDDQGLGPPLALANPSPRSSPSCPSFASLAVSQGHPLPHDPADRLLQPPPHASIDHRSSPTHAGPIAPTRSISSAGSGGRGPSPSNSTSSHSRSKSHSVLQRPTSVVSTNPSPSSILSPPLAISGGAALTKRDHLIHEIYTTERSYAQDLALVRDAYLTRFRPLSTAVDGGSEAGASSSPRTSSIRTFETAETSAWAGSEGTAGDRKSKSSMTSNGGTIPARGGGMSAPNTPGLLSPGSSMGAPPPSAYTPGSVFTVSDHPFASPSTQSRSGHPSSYFPSVENNVTSPARSSTLTSNSSQIALSHSVSMIGLGGAVSGGGGPAGPLSAVDVRAVFLNLEVLASLSDEFARELQDVEENVSEAVGENMVGETFLTMLPRLKQAYIAYCPRQAGAQIRYTQLAADSRYSSYFAESWNLVKDSTNAWDLPSLLIKPVQRVLKYPLLLHDLLRCTPPTHPDYANLTRAAREVKALADEINEVKRKREAVDSIIQGRSREVSGTMSIASTSTTKSKRSVFSRKDKSEKSSPGALSKGAVVQSNGRQPTASTQNPFNQVTMQSQEELRRTEGAYTQLVQRFMDAENTAKKLAKIMGASGSRMRDLWVVQAGLTEGWRRIINLNGLEPVEDIRIEAYRDVVYQILEGPCTDFDEKLLTSILPSFSSLLSLCKGPRTVILKRNSKHEDYNRLIKSGSLDRLPRDVVEGAQLFVALHHQLLLELPVLLDGFTRMLVLIRAAYADALATFHAEVKEKLKGFWWKFPPVVDDGAEEARGAIVDGPTIVRVWEMASLPTQDAMEEIPITKKISVRLIDAPVRIASGSATPLSHGISNAPNPKLGYPKGTPLHLATNHSAMSLSSLAHSRVSSHTNSCASSPTSPDPPLSQTQDHHKTGFSFVRSGKTSSSSAHANPYPSSTAALPSVTAHMTRTARAATNPLPPTSSTNSVALSPNLSQRHSVLSDASSRGPTLSLLSFEGSDGTPADGAFAENLIRKLSYPNRSPVDYDDGTQDGDRTLEAVMEQGHQAGARDSRSAQYDRSFGPASGAGACGFDHPYGATASQQRMHAAAAADQAYELDLDLSEVKYRCECVADFDLKGLVLDYMGYQFLNIVRGDELDILHEVGRVDELADFPLDVGLADDGLLIGRDSRGSIGFVLCSFLHPKFDDESEDFQ